MSLPLICLPLFGVGFTEWVIIGLAIALFFGASKLPKLGKGLGEGIRNFKKGIKGELDEDGNPIVKADDDTVAAEPDEAADVESAADEEPISDEKVLESEKEK